MKPLEGIDKFRPKLLIAPTTYLLAEAMPTDIIKRRIGVYPQTWEQRKRWEEAADKLGMPLSKFLVYIIDKSLKESPDDEKTSVADLKLDVAKKAEENNELKRELARMKKLITIPDNELEDYRNKAFIEKSFTGIRTYNRQLVDEGVCDASELSDMGERIREEVQRAADQAMEDPMPTLDTLLTDVWMPEAWEVVP